jgi:hypothetical protein
MPSKLREQAGGGGTSEPVHNPEAVQVLDGQQNLRAVDSHVVFKHNLLVVQMLEQLPTSHEIHDQIQLHNQAGTRRWPHGV